MHVDGPRCGLALVLKGRDFTRAYGALPTTNADLFGNL
jgi:hypothetical protein